VSQPGATLVYARLKSTVTCADTGSVTAHVDFTTRRYLADLLPAAEEPQQVPETAQSPVAAVCPVPGAPGSAPDAWMLLGAVAVCVWMIVATEIVVLVH